MKTFRWVAEIEISEVWVADGFELSAELLHDILWRHLGYAHPEEIATSILEAPAQADIRRAQGYADEDPAVPVEVGGGMDRQTWIHRAGGVAAAIRFENEALSIGREFLPSHAVAVLDGAEGTPDYWAWLVNSLDDAENESLAGFAQ